MHQIERESVVARGHRCVRGEDVAGTRDGQCNVEGAACGLHERARTLQDGERRVALVEMADLRPDAERAQQTPPANAEDDLLFQTQLQPAAI